MTKKNANGPRREDRRSSQAQGPTIEQMRAEMELHDPHSPNRLTTEEIVYQLKLAGHSVREIAAGTMKTEAEVEAMIMEMAEKSRSRLVSEMSIATIIAIDRLDFMLKKLWPGVQAGDLASIDRAAGMERERRKLMGLDAPEVKASLSLSADDVDLSLLNTDELKAWRAIQAKLAAGKVADAGGKKAKAALSSGPRSRQRGGGGSPPPPSDSKGETEATDVPFEVVKSGPRRPAPPPEADEGPEG